MYVSVAISAQERSRLADTAKPPRPRSMAGRRLAVALLYVYINVLCIIIVIIVIMLSLLLWLVVLLLFVVLCLLSCLYIHAAEYWAVYCLLGAASAQNSSQNATALQAALVTENWIYGCGDDDIEGGRGQIAADLDVTKLTNHINVCLGHCAPPEYGCTMELANTDCNCLKCMMHCLKSGSYVEECLYPEQIALCEARRASLGGIQVCNVDCDGAAAAHGGLAIGLALAVAGVITM